MKHAFSTSLAVCIFSLAGLSDAASIVISEPAIPRSYEGFTAQVTFDAPYCVSAAYPLIGAGELRADLFSITLSHLKPGACGNTFRVSVPGLPAQVARLQVSMTKGGAIGQPSAIAETVETTLSLTGYVSGEPFWTVRVESDGVYNPFNLAQDGARAGPVVLWPFSGAPLTGAGEWMETGASLQQAYTFRALRPATSGTPTYASTDLVPLYRVFYPSPLRGLYYTTDFTVAQQLEQSWNSRSLSDLGGVSSAPVGRLRGGACPVGMTPVYRAFHPTADIAHRYTQSLPAYQLLMRNGYIGEGPAWCAPER